MARLRPRTGAPVRLFRQTFRGSENVNQHPIAQLIEKADKAITQEDFDTVADRYTEDAVSH
jgi:hypothetical protein